MKKILDKWNQFLAEQQSNPSFELENLSRKEYYSNLSDEEWNKLRNSLQEKVKTVAKKAREDIFKDFTSDSSKKAFMSIIRAKSDANTSEIPDKSLLMLYEKAILPKLKDIIYKTPIIDSTLAYGPYLESVKYALQKAQKGDYMPGFAQVSFDPPHVFVNTALADHGGATELYDTLVHELAHIADYALLEDPTIKGILRGSTDSGFFSGLLKGDFDSLIKNYKSIPNLNFDKKGGVWHNWHRRPQEMYAVFKQIKAELSGRKEFFDDQGRIKLDYLKDYISDPKNKDRYVILKYLDIDKVEDIKKVFDQIVKVNNKVSRGSRIAEE